MAAAVEAALGRGDGFYVRAGVAHRYEASGSESAEAILGVAPDYRSARLPAAGLER